MVTRTRRAALRDRTPGTNTPVQPVPKTKQPTKGKAKGSSGKVSKKRQLTPPPDGVEVETPLANESGPKHHDETEESQEKISIGGFSFEDSQQSGVGLPGLGPGDSVILQSTPAPSWRRRQQTSQRVPQQSRSRLTPKHPAGSKASSPLPPSSPILTSPLPSSRPVEREQEQQPEPEHELGPVEDAPSEHLSDDPFGFLSTERKLRAKKGQPKRVNKGKAVERITPSPEPAPEPTNDDYGIEDLYASEDEAPPQRHQTPPPRQPSPHTERSSSLTPIQSPHTPSTPNKRDSNKRKISKSRESSPEPSAAPTSPSPSKPRVRSNPSAEEAETSARGRTRKKRKSEEMIEEEEEYDEEMDPSQIVEHLRALLPKPASKSKKRARAQAQAKGTRHSTRKTTRRGKAPSSEEESEPSPPRRPPSKRGGKKPASRAGKAKKSKEEEEDADLDELEVLFSFADSTALPTLTFDPQKARRERIAYFKSLENYQLAKENVYVV